jgi:hypothetical protein
MGVGSEEFTSYSLVQIAFQQQYISSLTIFSHNSNSISVVYHFYTTSKVQDFFVSFTLQIFWENSKWFTLGALRASFIPFIAPLSSAS